jgi:hypothetical protein
MFSVILDFAATLKPILEPGTLVFNPYPTLGCPSASCWPRGFPLNDIMNTETWNASFEESSLPLNSFGVLQSLADIQPDVDAIFRMTQSVPFLFEKTNKMSSKILILNSFFNESAIVYFFTHQQD